MTIEMSLNDQRIEPLSSEVVARLKSSTSITHLNGVVVELVKNAVDADAHTVYVTTDFQRGGCVIDDDGHGILPTEFEPGGGLGKPYHSSRLHSRRKVYGQRGSFLASLASLSLLTITSHHVRHPSTNTLILHHSMPVARLVPAPASRELRFSTHGTSVTVNDLFGNMPVRVKSRALALQKPDELDRQWDELRQFLVSLMLANDSLEKLVVSDASRDKKFVIRPRNQSQSDDILDLQRISSVLAQAGLAEFQNTQCWNVVSATLPDLSIHAAISLKPSPTKKVQFISVGMNPIYPRNNTNLLYSETNRLFTLSDFGAVGGPSFPSSHRALAEHFGDQSDAKSNSIAKTVNKWPMFYIRINVNVQEVNDGEDVPESDKPIQRIMDVLAAMINEFLKQHGLRPRAGKRKRKANHEQSAAQDTGKPTAAPDHSGKVSTEETLNSHIKLPIFPMSTRSGGEELGIWSKAKSAKDSVNARSRKAATGADLCRSLKVVTDEPNTNGSTRDTSLGVPMAAEQSRPTESLEEGNDNPPSISESDGSFTDRIMPWTDPYTGRTHLVNSRTGQSVGPHIATNLIDQRPRSTGCLQTVRTLRLADRPKSAVPAQSTWVGNLLGHWENPAFRRSEKPIHAIEAGHNGVADTVEIRTRDVSSELCGFETAGISKFRGKLLKQDLQRAEAIGQVDQKFILAKLKAASTSVHEAREDLATTLVLIDQHAADERCRVEALLEELFTPSPEGFRSIQSVTLYPLVFEIPSVEKALFGRYRDFFGSWGIDYTVEQKLEESSAFIFVHRVPLLIAERCRMEPNLVIELIRGELWSREETGMRSDPTDEDQGWVNRIKECPQGLIDLLNSRACRTAIMFNDELALEECQLLVSRLAQCVFPFQCAHGRPSMIPIVDIVGKLGDDDEQGEDPSEKGFVSKFQNWESGF